jgi:hypothetical protein
MRTQRRLEKISTVIGLFGMAIGAAVLLSTTSKDLGANAQAAAQQKVADVTLEYGQKLQAITSKFEATGDYSGEAIKQAKADIAALDEQRRYALGMAPPTQTVTDRVKPSSGAKRSDDGQWVESWEERIFPIRPLRETEE